MAWARESTARWGSGRHDTTCLPDRASQGHGPGLRPRHSTIGRFSCRAGPRSTTNSTGRASPRSTGCRQRERGEGRRCSLDPPEKGGREDAGSGSATEEEIRAIPLWIRAAPARRRPRRRRAALLRAATSSGRISPAACRGAPNPAASSLGRRCRGRASSAAGGHASSTAERRCRGHARGRERGAVVAPGESGGRAGGRESGGGRDRRRMRERGRRIRADRI